MVRIGRKPLAMLIELLQASGRIVDHALLRKSLWPDVRVSEAAYASVVRDLRRALGDDGRAPRFIATARGRGLRFAAELTQLPEIADAEAKAGDTPSAEAWPEVARRFEESLAALDRLHASQGTHTSVAARERSELLLSLGRARWNSGATKAAQAIFLEAASLARGIGDAQVFARAALGFAGRTDVSLGVRKEAVALLREAIEMLGKEAPNLRAETLARLGTELMQDDSDPEGLEARSLTSEAVRISEETGHVVTLAYSLTAHHFTQQRPDVDPQARLRIADRAIALARTLPPSDLLALGYQERLLDLLETGDRERFEETWAEYDALVDQLGQPFFAWIRELFRGSRALLAGDVDRAEEHAGRAFELGSGFGSPNALAAYAGQIFAIRLEQDRLAELMPVLLGQARDHQGLLAFRAAALVVAGEQSDSSDRTAEIRTLLDELGRSARDQHWLAGLAMLASATPAGADPELVRRLQVELTPFADRLIVVGFGAAMLGSGAHALGGLAARSGDAKEAKNYFRSAELQYARLDAPLWVARARRDLAALESTRAPNPR